MTLRFFVFLTIFFPLYAFSQPISYSYDSAGNRILKSVARGITSPLSERSNQPNMFSLKQSNGELSIIGYGVERNYQIRIYNIDGVLIESKNSESHYIRLSLRDYPSGTYIVRVNGRNNTTSYTIIKK